MITPSPERWARIENLLDTLIDTPAQQRSALLDEQCADDTELRAEVARLLAACESAERLYETPPLLIAEAAAAEQDNSKRDYVSPGEVVGAYRIVSLLGKGGMGAVYMAERADGAFQRRVALKIVKRGMDTEEIVGRFRRERQILARLEHPNIAGLFDGGITDGGLPYFVMELAPGQAIDKYCDEWRLPVEERLRLFVSVCSAVQYAHRNLVVHRDLKPGNILVSADGLKLLDFGIAKMLQAEDDPEPATRLHEQRLTPEYAAPEQVRGEPTTTATDVYSLGVILYELLTGRPPYRIEGGYAEIERTVCINDPKSPSSVAQREEPKRTAVELASLRSTTPAALCQRLSGDLDAIILRALQKAPERRYPSVEAFAEDIGRHLDGRPVIARPDTQWYRISKFVRRNAVLVGLSTAAVLALVGGSIATYLSRLEAVRQATEANRQRNNAEASRDLLSATFSDFDPDRLAGDTTFTLGQLMENSLRNLEPFVREPETYAVMANTLGRLFFNIRDTRLADSLYHAAYAILQPRGQSLDLANSMIGLGEIAHRDLRLEAAEKWLRESLAVRRAQHNPDPRLIGESLAKLGFVRYSRKFYDEADSLYIQVLQLGDTVGSQTRGFALEGRADVKAKRGDFAGAEELYRESLSVRTLDRPPDPATGRMLWGLASTLVSLKRIDEAVAVNRDALGILLTHYHGVHRDIATAYYNLGEVLILADSLQSAATVLEQAATISERAYPQGFLYTGYAWAQVGNVQLRLAKYGAAQASLQKAMAIYRQSFPDPQGADEARTAYGVALYWHGLAQLRSGGLGRAETDLKEAYALLSRPGGNPRAASDAAAELSRLYERIGATDSAAVYRQRATATNRGAT